MKNKEQNMKNPELLTPTWSDYELIDCGDYEKLERFGRYITRRPEPQAIWHRSLSEAEWQRMADASFRRDARSEERGEWQLKPQMPSRWTVEYRRGPMQMRMRLALTSFKHVGVFPEQSANWEYIYRQTRALVEKAEAEGKKEHHRRSFLRARQSAEYPKE